MAIGYLASMDQQLDFLNQMKLKNTSGDGTAVRIEMKSVLLCNAKIAPWRFGERVMASEEIEEVAILFHNLEQHKQLFVFDRRNDADFMFRMPSGYNNKIDELVAKRASDTQGDCMKIFEAY